MSDQNTYLLDGGNATSDFDGDNGTYVGSRSGVVPTPMESIEEVRVNTNNMTADFGTLRWRADVDEHQARHQPVPRLSL